MQIRTRGTRVTFSHTFLDADGEVVDTATATLKVSYPGEGWPHNGSDREIEEIDLTENTTTNVWTGFWDSRVSWPGVIFWSVYTDDAGNAAEDGHFRLRGNPANLETQAE